MEELKFRIIIAICIFSFAAIAWFATVVIRKRIKLRKEKIALANEIKQQEDYAKKNEKPITSFSPNAKMIIGMVALIGVGVGLYYLYKKRRK